MLILQQIFLDRMEIYFVKVAQIALTKLKNQIKSM